MMTCPTCSNETPEGAAFCPSCGCRLADPEPTIGALIDRFFCDYGYSGAESVAYRLKFWKREIGELTARELDRGTIEAHRDRLLGQECRGVRNGKLTPSAVRKYLFDIRRVFVEYEVVHPFDDVEIPSNGVAKFRLLTNDETAALLRETALSHNPHLFVLVTLGLECGLRKMECMSLKWEAVDFSEATLEVVSTRRGHSRTVALSDTAAETLRNHALMYRGVGQWCFPALAGNGDGADHVRDFNFAWETARRRAGLMDLCFEDLRNTFGVRLAEEGLCPVELARAMGYRHDKAVLKFARAARERLGDSQPTRENPTYPRFA